MRKDKLKIVEICWLDAQLQMLDSLKHYTEIDEFNCEVYCSIVGYLIKETEKVYVLAKEIWDEGSVKYIHIIPKCLVKKLKILQRSENGKKSNYINGL